MGIKYSDIDGIRNCEIHAGVLYTDTVGGRNIMKFDIPIHLDLSTTPYPTQQLIKRRVIAECTDGENMFVLYRNFHWNLVHLRSKALLDFGEIPKFETVYTYQLVGAIFHKNSFRAIYVDRKNRIGYIAENERSACLKDFDPKELVELFHINQPICLSKASDTPEIGYCGSPGNMYTIDYYSGEVKAYESSN